ncbi:hypothetical protein ACFL6D_02820 [Spirochaetota bacterium]
MKFKGGYNIKIKGEPSKKVQNIPDVDALYLPLRSGRLHFSSLSVKDGDAVKQGQVLAEDPDSYSVPLLAPRPGTVRLQKEDGHIVLDGVQKASEVKVDMKSGTPDKAAAMGSIGEKRYAALRLGVWQFFSNALTGELADPFGKPQAIIISAAQLEPFLPHEDVITEEDLSGFSQGLEYIHSLSEDNPLYVIISRKKSRFSEGVKALAQKHSWIQLHTVPARYPYDNCKLLAQLLIPGSSPMGDPVWAIGIEGVTAVGRSTASSTPHTSCIISVGGPGAKGPTHIRTVLGYPIDKIVDTYKNCSPVRTLSGGIFTGTIIDESQKGLDAECRGLTLIGENKKRDFLAFSRLGFTTHAFSNTNISAILPFIKESITTGIRGEHRPCLCCGFCEEVCSAGIMPNLLHRYTNKGRLEQAIKHGLTLCVQCGLCSYVCPSKIDVRNGLRDALEKLKSELLAEEEVS